jgi:lipopolysaccharide export system permease protein
MSRPWILWRYVCLDVAFHALLALAGLSLLIATGNVLRFLEDVVGTGVGLAVLGDLMLAILPSFLCYSIPTALVFGILITFGRMGSDNEILALQGAGISVPQMLPPVLALGAVAALTAGYLMAEVSPRSYSRMKRIAREVGTSAALLDPGEFREIGGQVLYYHERGGSACPLRGVVISQSGDTVEQRIVNAACGEFVVDSGGGLVFRLAGGSIHFPAREGDRYRRIRFADMDLPLQAAEQFSGRRWPREFTTPELIALESREQGTAEWIRLLWVQVHRRIAFPIASLVLAIVAAPLGIRPLRTGRSAGTLTAAGVMGGYWLIASTGEAAAEAGQIPALAGIWLANLVFLTIGIVLVRRSTGAEA